MPETKYFYATRSDILGVLEAIEREWPLKYVEVGTFFPAGVRPVYGRAADIPNFGVSTTGLTLMDRGYLAVDEDTEVVQQHVRGTDGVERTRVYQSDNPDSVEVQPAGMYRDECLIQGTLGSISDTRVGEELYNLVLDEMERQFSSASGVYLGPEARRYFEAGGRLTQAVLAPPECDFRPPREG